MKFVFVTTVAYNKSRYLLLDSYMQVIITIYILRLYVLTIDA